MAARCIRRWPRRPRSWGSWWRASPDSCPSLGDGFAAAFPDHGDQLYSFASWQRAGITVAGSSDAPVITADPRIGIRDAIVRRTGDGRVLGPAERLTARDALALYTTQAAYACHREGEIGSLEPGKLADFVVLDQNPLETEPGQIPDIGVLATVLGGTPVYQAGKHLPRPLTALRARLPDFWKRRGIGLARTVRADPGRLFPDTRP